jgi:hypothetical protein
MNPHDIEKDPALEVLQQLCTYDVGGDHARRLRGQCHSALETPDASRPVRPNRETDGWRRAIGVLAGAWCVLYVLETIRRAAAVYGL